MHLVWPVLWQRKDLCMCPAGAYRFYLQTYIIIHSPSQSTTYCSQFILTTHMHLSNTVGSRQSLINQTYSPEMCVPLLVTNWSNQLCTANAMSHECNKTSFVLYSMRRQTSVNLCLIPRFWIYDCNTISERPVVLVSKADEEFMVKACLITYRNLSWYTQYQDVPVM